MDINRPGRVQAGYQFQPAGKHDVVSLEMLDEVLIALGKIGASPVFGRYPEIFGLLPNPAVSMIRDNRTDQGV